MQKEAHFRWRICASSYFTKIKSTRYLTEKKNVFSRVYLFYLVTSDKFTHKFTIQLFTVSKGFIILSSVISD